MHTYLPYPILPYPTLSYPILSIPSFHDSNVLKTHPGIDTEYLSARCGNYTFSAAGVACRAAHARLKKLTSKLRDGFNRQNKFQYHEWI